jgi:hypothetical protein
MEEEDIYDDEFSEIDDMEGDGEEEFDGYDDADFNSDEEGLEGPEEEGDFDDPLERPETGKKEVVREKERIEITEKVFGRLVKQLETKPGKGSVRLFLQIFIDCLNDETEDRYRKKEYRVSELGLLNKILRYAVEVFPGILATVAEAS